MYEFNQYMNHIYLIVNQYSAYSFSKRRLKLSCHLCHRLSPITQQQFKLVILYLQFSIEMVVWVDRLRKADIVFWDLIVLGYELVKKEDWSHTVGNRPFKSSFSCKFLFSVHGIEIAHDSSKFLNILKANQPGLSDSSKHICLIW